MAAWEGAEKGFGGRVNDQVLPQILLKGKTLGADSADVTLDSVVRQGMSMQCVLIRKSFTTSRKVAREIFFHGRK